MWDHPSPHPWHQDGDIYPLLTQRTQWQCVQNNLWVWGAEHSLKQSTVGTVFFVSLPGKHRSLCLTGGHSSRVKGVGVGPIAPSFPPAARPQCLAEQPLGYSHGHVRICCVLGRVAGCGLSWRSVIKPGPCRGRLFSTTRLPSKAVLSFPRHRWCKIPEGLLGVATPISSVGVTWFARAS